MKKYLLIRITLIIVNLVVIFTVFYFAMEYATNEKYYQLPFNQYYNNTIANFKVYLTNIITLGDWGYDLDGIPVWETLFPRIKLSLKMNLLALAIYLPLGVLFGFITALLRNSPVDSFISNITLILGSVPTYIMMFLLIMFVGYYGGFAHYQYVRGAGIANYFIPVLALCLPPIATFTRVIRGELIESMNSDHLLLARVKGLNKNQLVSRHLLKNSLTGLLPEVPSAFLFALTGSFFVELMYHVPGVAQLFFESLTGIGPFGAHYVQIDLDIMMVILLFYTSITLIVILIADISYRFIDPRILMGTSKDI